MEYKDKDELWQLATEEYVCPVIDEYGKDKTETDWPFWWQNYNMFAVLGNIRNYSEVKSVDHTYGLPKDSHYLNETLSTEYHFGFNCERAKLIDDYPFSDSAYAFRCIVLADLFNFNYEDKVVDVRDSNIEKTYREFVGENFFKSLESLKEFVQRQANGDANRVRLIIGFN
jgi:hypothetical protein